MTSPSASRRASAAERRSSRLIRRDQPGRPGHPDGFKPTVDVQFGEDITYVGSHGVGRDHQILGYLPPSLALHHAQQHLSFPGGKQAEQVVVLLGAADVTSELTEGLTQHFRREPGLPLHDAAYDAFEFRGSL